MHLVTTLYLVLCCCNLINLNCCCCCNSPSSSHLTMSRTTCLKFSNQSISHTAPEIWNNFPLNSAYCLFLRLYCSPPTHYHLLQAHPIDHLLQIEVSPLPEFLPGDYKVAACMKICSMQSLKVAAKNSK